jgi:FkbM family methyltransferase
MFRKLEQVAQMAQGKGWDSGSVAREVSWVQRYVGADYANTSVLDIGANVGIWTEAAIRKMPGIRIDAFEPSPVAAREFTARNSEGIKSGAVALHDFALGAAQGKFNLFFDSEGSGLASLHNRRLDHFGIDMSKSIEVQVRTLDEWAETANLRPILAIKVDVEGSELDVLSGGQKTLERASVVQFEFGGTMIDSRVFFQDFWYLLGPLGFNLFRLTPFGARRVSKYSELDETFAFTNYFAVRPKN